MRLGKPPTMSRIVAGLARSRLVEITEDREDARRMRIAYLASQLILWTQGLSKTINFCWCGSQCFRSSLVDSPTF